MKIIEEKMSVGKNEWMKKWVHEKNECMEKMSIGKRFFSKIYTPGKILTKSHVTCFRLDTTSGITASIRDRVSISLSVPSSPVDISASTYISP